MRIEIYKNSYQDGGMTENKQGLDAKKWGFTMLMHTPWYYP